MTGLGLHSSVFLPGMSPIGEAFSAVKPLDFEARQQLTVSAMGSLDEFTMGGGSPAAREAKFAGVTLAQQPRHHVREPVPSSGKTGMSPAVQRMLALRAQSQEGTAMASLPTALTDPGFRPQRGQELSSYLKQVAGRVSQIHDNFLGQAQVIRDEVANESGHFIYALIYFSEHGPVADKAKYILDIINVQTVHKMLSKVSKDEFMALLTVMTKHAAKEHKSGFEQFLPIIKNYLEQLRPGEKISTEGVIHFILLCWNPADTLDFPVEVLSFVTANPTSFGFIVSEYALTRNDLMRQALGVIAEETQHPLSGRAQEILNIFK